MLWRTFIIKNAVINNFSDIFIHYEEFVYLIYFQIIYWIVLPIEYDDTHNLINLFFFNPGIEAGSIFPNQEISR